MPYFRERFSRLRLSLHRFFRDRDDEELDVRGKWRVCDFSFYSYCCERTYRTLSTRWQLFQSDSSKRSQNQAFDHVFFVFVFRLDVRPNSNVFSSESSLSISGVIFPSIFSFFCLSKIYARVRRSTKKLSNSSAFALFVLPSIANNDIGSDSEPNECKTLPSLAPF